MKATVLRTQEGDEVQVKLATGQCVFVRRQYFTQEPTRSEPSPVGEIVIALNDCDLGSDGEKEDEEFEEGDLADSVSERLPRREGEWT